MMEKLNELVEQAKFVADWHGSDWSSALCQDKDGKQAHEIICESRGEAVISTGSNSNEASWLCDYLELCSPANILAISEAFRALEQQRDALAAENAVLKESREVLAKNSLETCNEVYCAGFRNTALHDGLMESTGNRNAYPNPIRAMVDEATKQLATPATEAYLNSVRAEGVEIFAKHCDDNISFVEPEDEELYTLMEEAATAFAAQLRAGKDGE